MREHDDSLNMPGLAAVLHGTWDTSNHRPGRAELDEAATNDYEQCPVHKSCCSAALMTWPEL